MSCVRVNKFCFITLKDVELWQKHFGLETSTLSNTEQEMSVVKHYCSENIILFPRNSKYCEKLAIVEFFKLFKYVTRVSKYE